MIANETLDRHLSRRLSIKRSECKSKGLEFDLDIEWLEDLYPKGCAVTGAQFSMNHDSPLYMEIDRINHGKGYTKDNCRLVLAIYNRARFVWEDEDVEYMALLLYEKFLSNLST